MGRYRPSRGGVASHPMRVEDWVKREGIALAKQRGAYKGRKRPSRQNGQPSSFSAQAPVFQKPCLPVTTGSTGRPSTNTSGTKAGMSVSPSGLSLCHVRMSPQLYGIAVIGVEKWSGKCLKKELFLP